jgi:hypothetical protein
VDGIVPVTVNAWPALTDVALTAGAVGAVNAELTVTVEDAAELCVSGVVALSVTWSSNAYALPGDSVLSGIVQVSRMPPVASVPLAAAPHWVAGTKPPAPFTSTSHCQE